ncbi:MAG TPA: MotA/TolQ/ExbB proton channel family protein [Burkholderiales bacterium]|jgi:biopolymer transport protein ExbB|nr:MotA/TolQ/ExbB proton channel family protein [Burkholderiales bacterium]
MNPVVEAPGIAHFISQTDTVGKLIIAAMLIMSVATWYLIITKAVQIFAMKRRSAKFLESFWDAPSLDTVAIRLEDEHPDEPFAHLAYHGIVAARHHARHGGNKLGDTGSAADFLTRSMRRVIDEDTAKLESGLSILASVGSTAPFVGLFGTVWGVYHALVAIGMSGQGTLDKVAGPVGEALIMTAAGLAVAIPAVLAYNAFTRSNRMVLSQLDAYAHDLFAFLTTGSHFAGGDKSLTLRGAKVMPLNQQPGVA